LSWAFIHISKSKIKDFENIKFQKNNPVEFKNDNFIVSAGGKPDTCIFDSLSSTDLGFIVLGVGIKKVNSKYCFMNSNSWKESLDNFNPNKIDGHFVVIKWDKDEVQIFTDVLGLRDIYLFRKDDDIFLSTNPLLLMNFTNLEIDFSVFGSRWLLFNQISTQSIFKGIERISSGESISIDRRTLALRKNKHEFSLKQEKNFDINEFDNLLSGLITFPLEQKGNLLLSLSGGMDSRVLLSYLLNNDNKNWSSFTFGSENNPDSIIAEKIVRDYNLNHEFYNSNFSNTDVIIQELKDYVSFTFSCNPASEIIQLINYQSIDSRQNILIDGGFGEIWRRQFLNRLYFFSKQDILKKNIPAIIKYLTLPKADFFSDEVNQIMKDGVEQQIEEIFDKMPEVQTIGLANWLDLLAIKTRLPNIYSHEQTRLDQSLTCYMPFAQQSLLNKLFSIDTNIRKNSKLFRMLIKNHQPGLAKYPLAKNNFTYPFHSSPIRMLVTGKLKNIIGMAYNDDSKIHFLKSLSEFAGDLINSKSVKECPYYDFSKVLNNYEQFRKNQNQYSKGLDWFLSFEMIRLIIN